MTEMEANVVKAVGLITIIVAPMINLTMQINKYSQTFSDNTMYILFVLGTIILIKGLIMTPPRVVTIKKTHWHDDMGLIKVGGYWRKRHNDKS